MHLNKERYEHGVYMADRQAELAHGQVEGTEPLIDNYHVSAYPNCAYWKKGFFSNGGIKFWGNKS